MARLAEPPFPPTRRLSRRPRRSSSQPLPTHLQHNLRQARLIAFHTSPRRLLRTRAFTTALRATRRLVSTQHALRATARRRSSASSSSARSSPPISSASSSSACPPDKLEDAVACALDLLERLLSESRERALRVAPTVTVAQDVFVLLSLFLGRPTTPLPLAPGAGAGDAVTEGIVRASGVRRLPRRLSAPNMGPRSRSSVETSRPAPPSCKPPGTESWKSPTASKEWHSFAEDDLSL